MEVDIVGHSCRFDIEDINIQVELTISHFGDKKPLSLTLIPNSLTPSRLITYSKVENSPWKFD